MRNRQDKENSRDQFDYPFSRDEFFNDFLRLTPRQRGFLFILRTAYFFGEAPLTDQDIEGLCPALDMREASDLKVVLGKFFVRQDDRWCSQIVEDKLENVRSEQQRIKERSLKAKQKAQARWKTTSDKSQDWDATAMPQHPKSGAGAMLQHKSGVEKDATAMPQHAKSDAAAMLQHMQQHKNEVETDATAMPQHLKSDAGAMLQHMQQHTENSYPLDLKGKTGFEDAEGSRVRTRAQLIGRSADADIGLINKNINKSESASESAEESKNLNSWNTRETDSISEAVRWLSGHGLNPATAASFERKNAKNAERMRALPSIAASLGAEAEEVLERCRQAKTAEGGSFEHAVSFVLTSLERRFRQRQQQSEKSQKSPSASAPLKRFRDIDYREGIEKLNPDGTFVLKPRSERMP